MADANVEVVEKMYHCFKTGDLATLKAEVFAEDITWSLPGHHPLAGTKQGMAEVMGFFKTLRTLGLQVAPLAIGAVGADGVAELYHASGEVKGVTLAAFNCNYYTIRDGKIASVQVLMADQHGYDAFAWAAVALKPIPDRLADI